MTRDEIALIARLSDIDVTPEEARALHVLRQMLDRDERAGTDTPLRSGWISVLTEMKRKYLEDK